MGQSIVLLACFMTLALIQVSSGSNILCRFDKKVQITKISEFQELAREAYQQPESSCPSYVKDALRRLDKVVGREDICTQDKADQIRNFHEEYLIERKELLPKTARKFFIAYALRVSLACRVALINRELLDQSQVPTIAEDLKQVTRYISDDGLLALVVTDSVDVFSLNKDTNNERVFLQTDTVDEIRKVQAMCQRTFIPTYTPLIKPVATLAVLGYHYKRPEERRMTKANEKLEDRIYIWYRLVYLCESLKSIELIRPEKEEATQTDEAGRPHHSVTRILTKEKAEQLRLKSPELFNFEEKYNYKPIKGSRVKLDIMDQVYLNDDFEKAVDKYKTTRNFVSRYFLKMVNAMRSKVLHATVKYAFSLQGIKIGQKKVKNVDELIRALDEYVQATKGKQLPTGTWQVAKKRTERIFNMLVNSLIIGALFGTLAGLYFTFG